MAGIFRHVLLLFGLAAASYVIAIAFADGRLGFVVFFTLGLIAELMFWILFWRERRRHRHQGARSHA